MEHYLVPFGQEIENMRPSLRMNEASVFLWEKLSEYTDEKELALALAREYEVPQEELPEIRKDVSRMLRQFMAVGAVWNDFPRRAGVPEGNRMSAFRPEVWDTLHDREPWYRDMMIGGLVIRLYGSADCFSDQFHDFYIKEGTETASESTTAGISENGRQDACEQRSVSEAEYIHDRAADIDIIVTEETPPETENLPILIEGFTVTVLDGGDFYVIRSTEALAVREGHILKDGSRAVFFMTVVEEETGTDSEQKSARTADSPNGAAFGEENETDLEQ